MRIPRVFIDNPIEPGVELTLPKKTSHHIGNVLRMHKGERLHLFNGTGGYFPAEITSVNNRHVMIMPGEYIGDDCESPLKICLGQGISRGQHMDYTIQKAVELGVSTIVPVITQHSNVKLNTDRTEKRMLHWKGIIIHAGEQCGRNLLPELVRPQTLSDWMETDKNPLKIILEPTATSRLSELASKVTNISILSGPEGGFSEQEITLAEQNGYIPVKIGPRVLRTETAAVAVISICQVLWGDMG